MYRLFLICLAISVVFSCSTQPAPSSADWLEQIPVEDGWTYFAVFIPEKESPDSTDLQKLFVDRLLGYLGLDPSEQGDAEDEIQRICDEVSASEDIVLKEQGVYTYQGESVLAALFAIRNELLNDYQKRLLPFFKVDNQLILTYQLQAEEMVSLGEYGSAFISYINAARMAAEMNEKNSPFIFQQNLRAALALLPSLDVDVPVLDAPLYSGENMPDEAFLSIKLLERLGDSIPFEVYYPHPMNPAEKALARIRSQKNGVLEYSLPTSLWEGQYQISIKLDLEQLLGQEGMKLLAQSEDSRKALNTLQWNIPYQVILDPAHLELGILINDRDVLGNPVPQGNTGAKVANLLQENGQKLNLLVSPQLASVDVSLGALRDISMNLPKETDLLLIADTSIVDYQAVDGRIIISAHMEYRLWDLRTWTVLEQGEIDKQLESTQADQALNNLYTQLSRAMVQEYQRF